jgi:hypothetical protein
MVLKEFEIYPDLLKQSKENSPNYLIYESKNSITLLQLYFIVKLQNPRDG